MSWEKYMWKVNSVKSLRSVKSSLQHGGHKSHGLSSNNVCWLKIYKEILIISDDLFMYSCLCGTIFKTGCTASPQHLCQPLRKASATALPLQLLWSYCACNVTADLESVMFSPVNQIPVILCLDNEFWWPDNIVKYVSALFNQCYFLVLSV